MSFDYLFNRFSFFRYTFFIFSIFILLSTSIYAGSTSNLDYQVEKALDVFHQKYPKGKKLLSEAKGVLIFPSIVKLGVLFGGETGEGALHVNNKAVAYYRTTSGSLGFQLGIQKKRSLIFFMTDESLEDFKNSAGWTMGVDASVALITLGTGALTDISALSKLDSPVLYVTYDNLGFMGNLTLEAKKVMKINKYLL